MPRPVLCESKYSRSGFDGSTRFSTALAGFGWPSAPPVHAAEYAEPRTDSSNVRNTCRLTRGFREMLRASFDNATSLDFTDTALYARSAILARNGARNSNRAVARSTRDNDFAVQCFKERGTFSLWNSICRVSFNLRYSTQW